MAQEITLPVKLLIENLLNITKEMRSLLGTLKVDSSGYKKLESVIMDIEKRIQQLQVISSRPFVDTKLFTAVSKEIIGIQDDLTKVRIEAGKVKFSDLLLDASLKAKLEEFNSQIKNINDQLKAVKDSAKNTFFETDIGKAWKLNHADDAGKTFTQITKIIEGEVAKLERALHDAEKAQSDYLERLAARRKLSLFMKNGHGLTKENLGEDIYNSIFDKNGNFKGGGKSALLTWLEEQFKLDHNVVQSLTDLAGKKVREAFEDTKGEVDRALKQERTRINSSLTEENNRTNKGQTYAQDIVAALASLDAAKATKEGLSLTNIKLAKTEEDLSNALRKAKLDRDAYMLAVTRAAAGQLQMGSSCDKARAQLDSLNHTVDTGKAKLASLDLATSKLQGISNFVNRYVGAYAIIRKVSTAIRNAFNNIKELDKVITSIAVVTNMSLEDLWNKVGQYTAMALEYGVATKDVYSVSQIFYQLGLLTALVMDLTTETLKMAKIAGIDYSQAANAMTVAVRAFKIEMEDAQRVTDAYSALAAKFAVSSAEIANAMEKTASSAASVGMSLESTSAFISVMEQTTRESAQNIGSALKSIISRYGEMKASPDKLINVDGEEVAFNKVDTALASIGISIKDAAGQFRNFDDVIMELAAKWDTLDNNTQRYIATVMAGNRQQSRFIALVSNYDELSRAMNVANNSENASIVLVAKAMDSLETKANLLKNAFSQIYLDLHVESGLKDIYDWLTRILQTIGKLGVLKGALPTLMNIVGFGTGTKSLISEISKSVAARKLKLEADTLEAEEKIKAIEERASLPITKKFDVDTTAIDAAELRISAMANTTAINISSLLARADTTGMLTTDGARNVLEEALRSGLLSTELGRALFLTNMKIDPTANQGLMTLLEQFNSLASEASNLLTALSSVGLAAESVGTADLQKANAAVAAAAAADAEATQRVTDAELASNAALAEFNATHDLSTAHTKEAADALAAALADKKKTAAALEAALKEKQSADKKAVATEEEVRSEEADKNANYESANSELDEAKANRDSALHAQNVMKGVGIASAIARMAGTAITAAGAGHLDLSTDKVETSKLLTGAGNGLSMAATGASLGMMTGHPLAAVVGAIGGFLIGGLGAIIDGANMTIQERISLAEAEAKEKSDSALKELAKVLDLTSSLDNLKSLKNAMYNSTEDMLKYTEAMNTLGSNYPALISTYDSMGNAIIDLESAEEYLLSIRLQSAMATRQAALAEMNTRLLLIESLLEFLNEILTLIESPTSNYGNNIPIFTALKNLNTNALSSIMLYDAVGWLLGGSPFKDAENIKKFFEFFGELLGEGYDSTTIEGMLTIAKELQGGNWVNILEDLYNSENGEKIYAPISDLIKSSYDYIEPLISDFIEGGTLEYDFTQTENILNEYLKNNAKALGLGEDTTVKSLAGLSETDTLDINSLTVAQERLNQLINGFNNLVDVLNKLVTLSFAEESLSLQLLGNKDISTDNKLKIESSNIFSNLIVNGLERAADSAGMKDAASWSIDSEHSSEFVAVKETITSTLIKQIAGWSTETIDNFILAMSELDSYKSADEVLNKFNIETGSELEKDIIDLFINANLINKDRILKTIYTTDENGNIVSILNSDLKGLNKLSTWISDTDQKQITDNFAAEDYTVENEALIIALLLDNNKIISKYADYFTTQLLDINKLAEEGYLNLAKTRLSVLNELANTLSLIDDSETLKNLFSTITSIDLSSYDSIAKAIDNIKSYEELKGATELTTQMLAELEDAKKNLIFNVNTLVSDLTESISNSAKNIDSILGTNKSGLDLSKALDTLKELNVSRSGKDTLNFDDVFIFDAALGKYIYTVNGLNEALALNEKKLLLQSLQLEDTINKYVSSDELSRILNLYNDTFYTKESDAGEIADSLYAFTSMDGTNKGIYEDIIREYQELAGDDFTWSSLIEYLKTRREEDERLKELTDQQLEAYNKNIKNLYFLNTDWASIALGTDYTGTNKASMDALILELGMAADSTWEQVVNLYLDELYGSNTAGKNAAKAQINDSIIQDKTSQYLTAISEVLNYLADHYLSLATWQAANSLDIRIDQDIKDSALYAINTAEKFLEGLAQNIGKAGYTLEQYNQDAASILEKTISNGTRGKSLLDFVSEDNIGVSLLEGLANSLNLQLNLLVEVSTGKFKDEILNKYLVFDTNTGAYKIQGSFTEFITALNEKYGGIIDTTSKQYIDAVSAFNDAQISESTRILKGISDELNKIVSSKGGEQLNLATTFTQLRGKMSEEFINGLTELGAIFNEDGILTLTEGANIPAIVQELADLAAKNAALIPSDMEALSDAILDLLSSITDNITSGISGKLSNSGARNLQQWAKNNNLGELNFTRTKNGLKLSTEEATKLYEELRKIDTISAEIVLDALNESLEESVTRAGALKDEIASIRATTESDDFKFMDKDIPSGLNNPLNYFENWTKAFKALDEASKGTGRDKNKIAYQDYYNIITEMSNLAATSGLTFLLGKNFEVNATNAAELIERGAAALSVASDGTLKVDLSLLGIDFATGAKNLKQDVGKGIQEVAKSQIEMLDSMIQLLETIVAMEDLGDLADEGEGDKNVIEIDDILPELKIDSNGKITQIGEFSLAYTKWRDSILHQIKEINEDGSKNSDFNKDLADAMKAIKIGDFSFEEILGFSPSELAAKGEDFMKQYSAVLNSFWKAAQSGDYDLNNLFSSIREVLAGSGFEGEISIGDMKLIGKYNTVLMMDKDGNITTDDGTEFKGTNAFENAARYLKARDLDILKDASTTWNEETETVDVKNSIVTNVNYDLTKGTYLITFDDGTTATADSEAAANLAISTYATMMGKSIDGEITSNEEPQHFTIHKNGWMDLEFTLENGEVTVEETGTFGDGGHADDATSAVNKVLEEELKKADAAALAASGQTLESNIDNLNLQLSTDATATVDISDILITTTGTPLPVELTPTPDFKLGEGAEVKVNVDNITPESEGKLNPFTYDQLDATITTINAIYDLVPNKDQVNLHEIKYDTLLAAIKEVLAKFNGKPNIDGITLEDPTYSKMLGILLASIYLTRAEESSIDPTGITIGDNEVEIADIINALLTGELVLNGTDVPAIAGTITLADGTIVPIDSIKAEIALVIFELAEGASLDLDFEALGLKTEYEAPEAVVTLHIEVNYVYDENDPIGTLNRLRGIDNGIHDKVYSETFGRYIEDNFSLMDMGEGSDSFTFNVGGSFNIQDVELPEGWNLDEGSGLLTTTSEYYIPTQLRIELNEIDDSSLDDLLDKYEQLEEPVTAQVEIEDLTGEEFEEILNNLQAIEDKSPTEVVISQDVQLNDETKKLLDDINELELAIQDKSLQEIKLAAPEAPGVAELLGAVADAANSIPTDIGINVTISTSGSLPSFSGKGGGGGASYLMKQATGNVGLSNAKGTLMGELGPELVVSNGHYFVAGQNGTEFVDLADDAIVFNHLLTEQLLKHGMSKQRGQAVTNERNAVSFATGNIHGGPAMASAKAALAALKQLRALWKAIQDMGTKDLAGLGGSGNGGGGGNKKSDPKAFLKQLEIWYNWLQRIAVLEEKINYEEAKRNEISSSFFPNGKEYVQSQKESLDYLKEQAAVLMSLVESQQEYFEQRRAEMNSANNPFSALYTFDEYGQLKYKDGGLEQLSLLVGRNSLTGLANMSAEELYSRLVSMGYGKYMDYDSSGNPIDKEQDDWYVSAVQAFWDKIDSDKEEMQSLHDSIEEHKKALLEEEEKINGILKEIEDNLINLEQKVLKAIEESRQREIDELLKLRDAIEESSLKLIDGLSEQLQKERDMYSNDESGKELTSLQRQLAILQRSGGSASQIASLLKEISLKQLDAYFEAQQAQIDALQEATDNQLERLDKQIDIMTETLEYEKLYGMLWNLVYEVLNGTPEEIAQFIKENTSDYWSQSAALVAVSMREDLFEAEKFKAGIDYLGGINLAAEIYSKKAIEEEAKKKREEEERAKAAAATAEKAKASTSSSSSGGNSSSSGGASTPTSPNNNKTVDPAVQAAVNKALIDGMKRTVQVGTLMAEDAKAAKNAAEEKAASATSLWDKAAAAAEKLKAEKNLASALSAVTAAKAALTKAGVKLTTKASGGYVGHGIYELGEMGTETVLTAEQTQVLRNNILSNRPNSLISLLKSYNEGYNGINDGVKDVQKVTDNSTVIQNATVEMHVAKLASDYDAERAGEKALEKMISIARKTLAQNRIGR